MAVLVLSDWIGTLSFCISQRIKLRHKDKGMNNSMTGGCSGSFRLDRYPVVLHFAVDSSVVRQFHSLAGSPWISDRRTRRDLHPQRQLPRIVVRSEPRMALLYAQPALRDRIQSHLYGLVPCHRRLLQQGAQVPRPRDQSTPLRISHW